MIGLGPTPVLLTACDGVGNCSYCMVLITGIDITPPIHLCPPPITVPTDPGQCTGSVDLRWINDTAAIWDNCPLPPLEPKPDCTWEPVPKGIYLHIRRAEHPRYCHLLRLEQHWQGGVIDQYRLFDLTTGDEAYRVRLRDLPLGINPIDLTYCDASGNCTDPPCTWLVTVEDREPPEITCLNPVVPAGPT